jgi:thioester reductase-like protein
MDTVFTLLNRLAGRGIRLSVEGDELTCYAQKGSLTSDIRACIGQNKSKLLNILRDYKGVKPVPGTSDERAGTQPIPELTGEREPAPPLLELEAEAVLDPDIQPSEVIDNGVKFTAAKTILLTGASGFLGAYLLHDLMAATEACVYCLVRSRSESEGSQKIKNNLLKYGLWSDDFASRIVPVPGDLGRPLLGVGAETFGALCKSIDAIYHSGALVNHVYPYRVLKDSNVRGTEEVVRLASRVRLKALHFISTVGVFSPTKDREIRILESDPLSDGRGLVDGYRQSKWVAEKIVAIAADRGLPVRIYRPGLVTGDATTGIWNTGDFLPRMIKGCIQLGSAPDRDAIIDMVPVDYVSRTIVHLSLQPQLHSGVFHVVNPHSISAIELGRLIVSFGYKTTAVSYADWRDALLEDAKTSSNNALYPLLTMFTDDPPLDLVPAFDCRRTLEGLKGTQIVCPAIDAELMATYLSYFRNSGFLAA